MSKYKNVIITAHGIRWKAPSDWQNAWAEELSDPETLVLNYRYGRILGLVSWMNTWKFMRRLQEKFLWQYVSGLRKMIDKVEKKFPDADISIMAHSFGGYITEKTMESMENFNIFSIVYVNCPISSHIEESSYRNWLGYGDLKRVVSIYSKADKVIGKVAVKPFGKNGYFGFIRYGVEADYNSPAVKPYENLHIYNYTPGGDHGEIVKNPDIYGSVVKKFLVSEEHPVSS